MVAIRRGETSWGILAHSIGPRVRVLRNALTARAVALSTPFDLPSGSLTVLALVAANPGTSQTLLARRAGINKSALVGIVDQLEGRGLATRDRSVTDRRRNSLSITPEGEALLERLHATNEPIEQPIQDALDPAEIGTLIALLDRAVTALEASGPHPGEG